MLVTAPFDKGALTTTSMVGAWLWSRIERSCGFAFLKTDEKAITKKGIRSFPYSFLY